MEYTDSDKRYVAKLRLKQDPQDEDRDIPTDDVIEETLSKMHPSEDGEFIEEVIGDLIIRICDAGRVEFELT